MATKVLYRPGTADTTSGPHPDETIMAFNYPDPGGDFEWLVRLTVADIVEALEWLQDEGWRGTVHNIATSVVGGNDCLLDAVDEDGDPTCYRIECVVVAVGFALETMLGELPGLFRLGDGEDFDTDEYLYAP